jgi:hypothetical protein
LNNASGIWLAVILAGVVVVFALTALTVNTRLMLPINVRFEG